MKHLDTEKWRKALDEIDSLSSEVATTIVGQAAEQDAADNRFFRFLEHAIYYLTHNPPPYDGSPEAVAETARFLAELLSAPAPIRQVERE